MIEKKYNLRALKPGQWARVIVPDFPCWQNYEPGCYQAKPGLAVDICVIPCYTPRYDSDRLFYWTYRVAYRHLCAHYPRYLHNDGGMITPWYFDLVESTKYFYDSEESKAHYEGKGRWLYTPASDDPALCPGPDCSVYHCTLCDHHVMPFSDDDGTLLCPYCEARGLVILDNEVLDQVEQAREFATLRGLKRQFEQQLDRLATWGQDTQALLHKDFAPHSFSFALFKLPTDDHERRMSFNGGLIYSGPECPGDGSFPSLSVNLHSDTGWFIHT
jgi:hypothetical protein